MSRSLHRARPQTDEPVTSAAMARTASKSPTEAMGNPASMTSTPSAASARAISSFSAMFMLAPGDCSPSRKVVSKIRTRFVSGCDAGAVGSWGWDVLMIRLFPRFFLAVQVSRITTSDQIVRLRRPMETRGSKNKKPRDPPGGRVSGLRWLLFQCGVDEP